MVDGAPVVEWSPKLSAAEEARRRYTIYGRAGLESGAEWHSPTNELDRQGRGRDAVAAQGKSHPPANIAKKV